MERTVDTPFQKEETAQPASSNACLSKVCVNTVSLHLNPHCRINKGLEIEGIEKG